MRVILHNSGNYGSERFLASDQEQDVPNAFGKVMVARGYATEVKRSKSTTAAAPSADEQGED